MDGPSPDRLTEHPATPAYRQGDVNVPDYGRPLEFGISLSPDADAWPAIAATVREADRLGLDFIGIQDHPYQRRFVDTMVLLASLAAITERLRVFPDVACLPLRHPAMLANEAASVDAMSGGRFELGLGAGAFWDAIVAMGGPRRSPGEALEALAEAVAVMHLLWSGDRGIKFDGDHYKIDGIHSGPVPAHDIEIWFGVGGPRALRLLGQVADGWLPSIGRITLEELDGRHAIIDEAANEAGRDPADIRRLANISGQITDGAASVFLEGPPDQWVDEVTALVVEHGLDTLIFWPGDDPLEQTRRFAELVPAFQASVVQARS